MERQGYAVMMQTEGGRWVRLASFRTALDADRLFELLKRSGATRPLAIELYRIVDVVNEDKER